MAAITDTRSFVRAVQDLFGVERLREHQQSMLRALLDGRDVFLSVRTGGGKSLCYMGFPAAAKALAKAETECILGQFVAECHLVQSKLSIDSQGEAHINFGQAAASVDEQALPASLLIIGNFAVSPVVSVANLENVQVQSFFKHVGPSVQEPRSCCSSFLHKVCINPHAAAL
ncbi:hypothetical protein Bbelb_425880 [Branchiostoma belcheri]|nr:hypothetical protein Bbelb_425880 [Branchiostoma belcheri]